ncbi:MAG: Glu-tRNA(Gln) amidotransferase GatDE subunit E [Candidatus Aenigmatarchaeota archaeon]|nr:MAG: Glu-tRNA(Gln) amidotransferase GatDE subunit E [Candidatus Aenigmarchaeota archaeon]
MVDYKKIGLKIGIEIHQRLATKTKLFCNCSTEISDEEKSIFEFSRKLRPTASETGEVDNAAMQEFLKEKEFIYYSYPNCCSIETDSKFPNELNKEALLISLQLAKMLRMRVPDSLQIMRKIVIDGSNTTGYQRTSLVGKGDKNSYIETNFGKVHIQDLNLEEESATKIKEKENRIYYRLDRLGIPLIELSCHPDIWHPEQAKEFASKIGLLLRSLNVKRGIGTIRQDVNISVKKGSRIEIKGFQELKKLDKLIKNEVKRQLDLILVKEKLKNKSINLTEIEVTKLFKSSKCKILKGKEKILCLKLKGLSGLFKNSCGEIILGKEIANYAKIFGIGGIIHSDEDLKKYNFDLKEIYSLKKEIGAKERDLFLLITGENCGNAMNLIKKRILHLNKGIPEETRFAEDVLTRYARELPGAARMYPETDLPKIDLNEYLDKIELPETLEEKSAKFLKLGLSKDLAKQISKSKELKLFEEFLKYKVEPKLIADLILNKKRALERKGIKIEKKDLEFVLKNLEKEKIVKKAIEEVLINKNIKGFEKIPRIKLKKITVNYAKKYGEKAMGEIMKKYGKRVDSEEVIKLLNQ